MMRGAVVLVLCAAAIATAQKSDAFGEAAAESRQGFPDLPLSQGLPTQPLFGLAPQQQQQLQLLPQGSPPPLQGALLLPPAPLALNGQLYGLGGQGLLGPGLQGLGPGGLLGPGLQLRGQLQRRGLLANALGGPADLRRGRGGQTPGPSPFFGRRGGGSRRQEEEEEEPLADLIQLASLLREEEEAGFPAGGGGGSAARSRLREGAFRQHGGGGDDELSLLLQTLGSLRSLQTPPSSSRSPRLTLPPPFAFPFRGLSRRRGLGDDPPAGGLGPLDSSSSFYLDRTPNGLDDQFRFP